MKTAVNPTAVQSNLSGTRVKMTIDDDAEVQAHIMRSLAGLYGDQETAIIREYSTNGRDSHIAAGCPERPIEVTLPTDFQPFLTIKDFGLGMDLTDIENVYSKYGTSTKRDSNDFNGTLGFGSKSAFAYAAQFTLVTVKDGMMYNVSVAKDEDDTASMTVQDPVPTEEPNGVEIIIPVKRYNNIARKAKRFFSYWPEGTVLLKDHAEAEGYAPERVTGTWVTDDLLVIEGTGQHKIVMGNVAYPVEFEDLILNTDRSSLIAFVPIGDVEFAPARESLKGDPKTRAAIERVQKTLNDTLTAVVQAQVDAAPSAPEAMVVAFTGSQQFKTKPAFTYKGKPMPTEYKVPDEKQVVLSNYDSHKLSAHSKLRNVYPMHLANALFVHGYDKVSFTPAMKKKLKKYVDDKGMKIEMFVLSADKLLPKWTRKEYTVDWPTIQAIKLPRDKYHHLAKEIPGSYDVYVDGREKEIAANDLGQNKLMWVGKDNDSNYAQGQLVKNMRPGWKLVILPSNRKDKFLRNFPRAKAFEKEVPKLYRRATAKFDRDALLTHLIKEDYWAGRDLKALDASRILDPEVVKAVQVFKSNRTADKKAIAFIKTTLSQFSNFVWMVPQADRVSMRFDNPLDHYPLFDRDHMEDSYLYMNTKYERENPQAAVAADEDYPYAVAPYLALVA